MIGTSADIPYVDFLLVSTPLAIFSAVIAIFVIRFSSRKDLVATGDPAERREKVAQFDEWALVKDRSIFLRCAVFLGFTSLGFAFAQQLGVGLFVLIGAVRETGLLVITCPHDHTDSAHSDTHSLTRQSLNPVLIV
jgi:Na+/H+ antiporter NhaD/arsenite permease-like protein